jgi:hypothetical protein
VARGGKRGNLARANDSPINANMESSDEEELDIYISNSTSIIEDELITYLEEKRENRKVSFKILLFFNNSLIYSYNSF